MNETTVRIGKRVYGIDSAMAAYSSACVAYVFDGSAWSIEAAKRFARMVKKLEEIKTKQPQWITEMTRSRSEKSPSGCLIR